MHGSNEIGDLIAKQATQESAEDLLMRWFAVIDVNGDGVVDRKEYSQMVFDPTIWKKFSDIIGIASKGVTVPGYQNEDLRLLLALRLLNQTSPQPL